MLLMLTSLFLYCYCQIFIRYWINEFQSFGSGPFYLGWWNWRWDLDFVVCISDIELASTQNEEMQALQTWIFSFFHRTTCGYTRGSHLGFLLIRVEVKCCVTTQNISSLRGVSKLRGTSFISSFKPSENKL